MKDQRARILRYLRRENTDGIPFDLGFNMEAERKFAPRLDGKTERAYFECPVRSVHPALIHAKRITSDTVSRMYPHGIGEHAYIDEWGICTTEHRGSVYVQNPMAEYEDPEDLDKYPFPDYSRPECYAQAAEQISRFHEQGYAVIIKAERLIFAMGRDLRGYENHLMDYCINPELNEVLLDHILRCQTEMVRGMASTGADIIS